MPDDRISKLSERFRTHAVGRRATSNRTRERHSFYLDAELVTRLDQTYRAVNHELYPGSVTKSAFLEALIEYGLDHVADLKSALAQPEE